MEDHPHIAGHPDQDTPLAVVEEHLHIVDRLDQGSHLVVVGDIALVVPVVARSVSTTFRTV